MAADSVAYGLDKELKAKQAAKYDAGLEKEVTGWIEAVCGVKPGDGQTFAQWLKDGQVLCKLINSIRPDMIKKVNTSSLAFKQMENITFFTNSARELGVPESAMFGTPDLYEEKNVFSVVNCVYTLGGAIQVSCPEFKGPQLGVPLTVESKDKRRSTGIITDQSQGYSTTCEVQRPTERLSGIVRPNAMSSSPGAPAASADVAAAAKSSESAWIPAPRDAGAAGGVPAGKPSPGVSKDLTEVAGAPAPTAATSAAVGGKMLATPEKPASRARTPSPLPPKVDICAKGEQQGAAPSPAPTVDDGLYGMDRELRAKQDAKYDVGLERQVVEWIEFLTGEKKGEQSFGDWLKNGQILCRLVNAVKPGTIKKVNTGSLAFKQMENITFFTNAARELGVPESAMFATPDLYEEKNLGSVVNCLYTFGGVIQASCPEYDGPPLGVAMNVESKDKKRGSGICVDQSGGYSATMDVSAQNRPFNNK